MIEWGSLLARIDLSVWRFATRRVFRRGYGQTYLTIEQDRICRKIFADKWSEESNPYSRPLNSDAKTPT